MGIQIPAPFAGVAWTRIKVDHGDPQSHYCRGCPHSARVPSKTALATVTCPLGTHSSDRSNPRCVVVVHELERAPNMPHDRHGSHLLLKTALCCNWATRNLEGVIFDAPNQSNRLLNDYYALKKKDRLHPYRFINGIVICEVKGSGLEFCNAACRT